MNTSIRKFLGESCGCPAETPVEAGINAKVEEFQSLVEAHRGYETRLRELRQRLHTTAREVSELSEATPDVRQEAKRVCLEVEAKVRRDSPQV